MNAGHLSVVPLAIEEGPPAHMKGVGEPRPLPLHDLESPSVSLVRLTTDRAPHSILLDDEKEGGFHARIPKQGFQVDLKLDLKKSHHQPVQSNCALSQGVVCLRDQAEE
jgi:hypothetical protein